MAKKISRREALKGIGAAGATVLISASPGLTNPAASTAKDVPAGVGKGRTSRSFRAAPSKEDFALLVHGDMIVTFDKRYGSIYAIKKRNDPLDTNFMGNTENTRGIELSDTLWTGDLVSAVWEPGPSGSRGRWRRELTENSGDIRSISFDGNTFALKYHGRSQNKEGIKSYNLAMKYHFAGDGSLLWDIDIQNTTAQVLEIGELAFPLRVNDDYVEAYKGTSVGEAIRKGNVTQMQKFIHEQKVFAHHFIAGHSSYALIQRPAGIPPFLLIHAMKDTAFECIYKSDLKHRVIATAGVQDSTDWIGTDLLAIHSWGTKCMRRW